MGLNWKPIRTVPRDGRPVLLCQKYWRDEAGMHGGSIVQVVWSTEHLCWGTIDGRSLMSGALLCTHWAEVPDFDGDDSTETMLEIIRPEWEQRDKERDARLRKRSKPGR